MDHQQIIQSTDIVPDLAHLLRSISYERLFVLMDVNTEKQSLPLIETLPEVAWAEKLIIPAGEENKSVDTLVSIWKFFSENGATRNSLLINLGGGMLTDLGGFAAATFKRGIRFINIPTTLLGAVDAAVGGKTGINFNKLKNEVGVFCPAIAVVIHSGFFRTLDTTNLLSGYAEMLKHALLSSEEELIEILKFDWDRVDYDALSSLLLKSIQIKTGIVAEDPFEKGIRKALNLGHTFGHAFESLSHKRGQPIPHGYAIAWGLVCELYLSYVRLGFDKNPLLRTASFVKENYGKYDFDCSQYKQLNEWMQHDKKNESGVINFTLLRSVGDIEINQHASPEEIEETLDFYREF